MSGFLVNVIPAFAVKGGPDPRYELAGAVATHLAAANHGVEVGDQAKIDLLQTGLGPAVFLAGDGTYKTVPVTLPTDQGAELFLAGDGTYKAVPEQITAAQLAKVDALQTGGSASLFLSAAGTYVAAPDELTPAQQVAVGMLDVTGGGDLFLTNAGTYVEPPEQITSAQLAKVDALESGMLVVGANTQQDDSGYQDLAELAVVLPSGSYRVLAQLRVSSPSSDPISIRWSGTNQATVNRVDRLHSAGSVGTPDTRSLAVFGAATTFDTTLSAADRLLEMDLTIHNGGGTIVPSFQAATGAAGVVTVEAGSTITWQRVG